MQRNSLTFPKDSFLARIDDKSWEMLSKVWTVSSYTTGQFLIDADDDGRDVFFVLRGSAKAKIYTPNGREVSFVTIHIGDCFGEFAAIDDAPRSAAVIASGECLAARLSPAMFRKLVSEHQDIAFNLLSILVGHLREFSGRVVDFNSKSADVRLGEALVRIATKAARNDTDDVLIERPPTQPELAAYVFASREGVAREMGRMRNAGVIGREKRSLHIPSIQGLRN